MKILITAATIIELQPLMDSDIQQKTNAEIIFHCSGIGMMATCFSLTQIIAEHKPDLVIQAGIAGCFDKNLPLGSVVVIEKEYIADLGVSENNDWKDVFDMNLIDTNEFPFAEKQLINPHLDNLNVLNTNRETGITINNISTDKNRIEQYSEKYHPTIESMEGAALHYVCLQLKVPFIQIRSISNIVGERDKQQWKIKEAITNLTIYLQSLCLNRAFNYDSV